MALEIGDVVHYVLSESDAIAINRRRTNGSAIQYQIAAGTWPLGAQAHIGNYALTGDHVAAVVVALLSGPKRPNLQCILDGTDTFWVTSASFSEDKELGTWHYQEERAA